MTLPAPDPRRLLHSRNIDAKAFARDDGSIDVEGTLTDMRTFPATNPWRGTRNPDEPVHLMRVRMTIDVSGVIRNIIGEIEAAPYPGVCQNALPNLQRLVGITIGPGFSRWVQKQLGGTACCSHLVALILSMANVAMAGIFISRSQEEKSSLEKVPGDSPGNPQVINGCVALAADGPVVKTLFPQYAAPTPADGSTIHAVKKSNTESS